MSPRSALSVLLRTLAPIALALLCGALLLGLMGVNPLVFYAAVVRNGLGGNNWTLSLALLAPLLVLALGLLIAFKASLWNLGYDGLFLIGAVLTAGLGSRLGPDWTAATAIPLLLITAFAAGALWSLLPAWLKIRWGTNEIITTLMMSIIAVSLANILLHQFFQDPTIITPQTGTIAHALMLPTVGGVNTSLLVALALALLAWVVLERTAWGLKITLLGNSRKTARHVGLHISGWTGLLFIVSSGLMSLAGSLDMLSRWGYLRANWNPGYGNQMLPFVFLARLNPLGAIPLAAFYAVFVTGGTVAAQQSGLSTSFLQIIVALILIFLTLTEYLAARSAHHERWLPEELFATLRQWQLRRTTPAAGGAHGAD